MIPFVLLPMHVKAIYMIFVVKSHGFRKFEFIA